MTIIAQRSRTRTKQEQRSWPWAPVSGSKNLPYFRFGNLATLDRGDVWFKDGVSDGAYIYFQGPSYMHFTRNSSIRQYLTPVGAVTAVVPSGECK